MKRVSDSIAQKTVGQWQCSIWKSSTTLKCHFGYQRSLSFLSTSQKCSLQSFHQSQWRPFQKLAVTKYSSYNVQIET